MRIILLERVSKLGQMGDVVNVKSGYARNFLLPRNKAAPATKEHINFFEQRRAQLEAHNLDTKNEALDILKKVEKVKPTIIAQASEMKQLYGSVKARDIVAAITEQGVTISHKQINLLPIKMIGLHSVKIELHPEVSADVLVCIATNDEEARDLWKSGEVASQDNVKKFAPPEIELSIKADDAAQPENGSDDTVDTETSEESPQDGEENNA